MTATATPASTPTESVEAFAWDGEPGRHMPAPPIFCLVVAEAGLGKTHLGCTFPGPVVCLDTEHRANTVLRRFTSVFWKRVLTFEDVRGAVAAISRWKQPGTVLLDSASDLNGIVEAEVVAELNAGKQKVHPTLHWTQVYERIAKLCGFLRERGWNVVFTARLGDEYENDKRTGKRAPSGFVTNKLLYHADFALELVLGADGKRIGHVLKNGARKPGTYSLELPDEALIYAGIVAAMGEEPISPAPEKVGVAAIRPAAPGGAPALASPPSASSATPTPTAGSSSTPTVASTPSEAGSTSSAGTSNALAASTTVTAPSPALSSPQPSATPAQPVPVDSPAAVLTQLAVERKAHEARQLEEFGREYLERLGYARTGEPREETRPGRLAEIARILGGKNGPAGLASEVRAETVAKLEAELALVGWFRPPGAPATPEAKPEVTPEAQPADPSAGAGVPQPISAPVTQPSMPAPSSSGSPAPQGSNPAMSPGSPGAGAAGAVEDQASDDIMDDLEAYAVALGSTVEKFWAQARARGVAPSPRVVSWEHARRIEINFKKKLQEQGIDPNNVPAA